MTLTLELPTEIENGLREAAAREGVDLYVLAIEALREVLARTAQSNADESKAVRDAKAARLGVPVERYALGVLRHDAGTDGATANGAARPRASGFGKFAHLNVSSADVHRDRREEVAREESRLEGAA
jgi:hypothetical protein